MSESSSWRFGLGQFEHHERVAQLQCAHRFHDRCIRKWLSRDVRCPNCRFSVVEELMKKLPAGTVVQSPLTTAILQPGTGTGPYR